MSVSNVTASLDKYNVTGFDAADTTLSRLVEEIDAIVLGSPEGQFVESFVVSDVLHYINHYKNSKKLNVEQILAAYISKKSTQKEIAQAVESLGCIKV